jgi:hypothetical protein
MTEIPEELRLFRGQLLDAIDRDLRRHRRRRLGIPTFAAVAAAAAAVVLGLTLTASSPPSAYAAAKKAVALTAAAASGTITGTVTSGGSSYTLDTTQWNGDAFEVTQGDRSALGPDKAIEVVDGDAYVQQSDGTWLHYASESDVGPKVGPIFELAHNDVQGNTAGQILSLATQLTQTTQSDGTALYSGFIPDSSTDTGTNPNDSAILRVITNLTNGADNKPDAPGGYHDGLQLQMTVGPDGFVRQVNLSYQQQGTGTTGDTIPNETWTITYGKLGSTPPIAPPTTSTPTPPVVWSSGPVCGARGPCGG